MLKRTLQFIIPFLVLQACSDTPPAETTPVAEKPFKESEEELPPPPQDDTWRYGTRPEMIKSPEGVVTPEEEYKRINMTDTVLTTWWTPDGDFRSGKGAWIALTPAKEDDVYGLIIHPGAHNPDYPQYGDVFPLNNRVKEIKVTLPHETDPRVSQEGLESSTTVIIFELPDKDSLMCLRFPQKVPKGPIHAEVLSVYPGSKWNDLCISHLRLCTEVPQTKTRLLPVRGTMINVWKDYLGNLDLRCTEELHVDKVLPWSDIPKMRKPEDLGYEALWGTYSCNVEVWSQKKELYTRDMLIEDVFHHKQFVHDIRPGDDPHSLEMFTDGVVGVHISEHFDKPAWHILSFETHELRANDELSDWSFFLLNNKGENVVPPGRFAKVTPDSKYLVWFGKDSTFFYDFTLQKWRDYQGPDIYGSPYGDEQFFFLLEKGIVLAVSGSDEPDKTPGDMISTADIIACRFTDGRILKRWKADCLESGLYEYVNVKHEGGELIFGNGEKDKVVIRESEIYGLK